MCFANWSWPNCINFEIDILMQNALKHYSLVFDAIKAPRFTKLFREAQRSGAMIVYGTEMFINQAFNQFEKFTGLPGWLFILTFTIFNMYDYKLLKVDISKTT